MMNSEIRVETNYWYS